MGTRLILRPRVKKYAEEHEFIPFEFGIKKRRTSLPVGTEEAPLVDEHPLLFPTTLRHVAPYENGKGSPSQFTDSRPCR